MTEQRYMPPWMTEIFDAPGKKMDMAVPALKTRETGQVLSVGGGIARAGGLPGVQYLELIRFENGQMGMVFNLDSEEIGIVLLNADEACRPGSRISRTHRVTDVPVGDALLGRVVDAIGRPLDRDEPVKTGKRLPVEQEAPLMLHRAPVQTPLQTGIKAIDALIPIGRGQRELIIGDRQTGKTAIAIDAMINQKAFDVICIYCAIAQKSSDVAGVIAALKESGMMDQSIVVAAAGDDTPGLQFLAPYAATTMGEYFMKEGRDVLIVYDDLTHHARAYRELSLLLRRPPAREAYPGDIFYIHSRLLERSTHLKTDRGGGSLTALPVVETQAQNISAYIPTNLISITDGQIYLSPQLFRKGVLPAVDVGKSVSRVGGKTQLPAFRQVAGDLRLSYSQFIEVEKFARYSTRIDESTRATLHRGERVREILKQKHYDPHTVAEQAALLLAVNEGLFDTIEIDRMPEAVEQMRMLIKEEFSMLQEQIAAGETLDGDTRSGLLEAVRRQVMNNVKQRSNHAGHERH